MKLFTSLFLRPLMQCALQLLSGQWLPGVNARLRRLYFEAWHIRVLNSLEHSGVNVVFEYPAALHDPSRISVGDDVHIAEYVHMWGLSGIRIGPRTMIGSHTAISTVTHDYTQQDMYATVIAKEILIGADVWIGAHSMIMPGITLGDGCVVGAGAVVTKSVPPRAIVAGVPAKLVGTRP